MHTTTDVHQRVIHRIRIAKGHVKKVLEMVEDGKYCIDVINQSKAVQNALKEVDFLLLENHLETCVVDFAKNGKSKSSVEEIMRIFKRQ